MDAPLAQQIAQFGIWYVVFLFSLTFHEYAHALVAYRGGDLTAYQGGQVSLDPVPHVRREPFGMVIMPLLTFFMAGWMMGWASTPYDPEWGRRHPRRQALMALAGPVSNFLLALVALIAMRVLLGMGVFVPPGPESFNLLSGVVGVTADHGIGSPLRALAMGLSILLNLNVLLGLFNLLPLPPLDGAGVLEGLAPRRMGRLYDSLRTTPMAQIMGLLIAWKVFGWMSGPALITTLRLLYS